MSLTAQIKKSVISKQTQWKITKQYKKLFVVQQNLINLKMCFDSVFVVFLFFLMQDTDPENTHTKGMKMGILTVIEDDVATIHSNPNVRCLSVVLEEQVVLDNVKTYLQLLLSYLV